MLRYGQNVRHLKNVLLNELIKTVKYRQISNISRTWVHDEIIYLSDVLGALPVGATQTTSSFST